MKLRYYQEEACNAVEKALSKNRSKILVGLPTGSGKTLTIAETIKRLRVNKNIKIVVLSHVKEILEQNHESISKYMDFNIGINSAMLGKREVEPITVAGIQSVFRSPHLFKDHNVIIVDEAHMISTNEDTMYAKFFDGIGNYTCIGYTATPFRLQDGLIYGKNKMFSDIVCDWTRGVKYQKLVDDGFLSKLTTKETDMEMDVTGIPIIAGDYSEKELSNRFDREPVTKAAIQEVLYKTKNRKKVLIFAMDIKHAEHITEELIKAGEKAMVVHSKMNDYGFDRSKIISQYRDDQYKYIVNVNIMTTGIDIPDIDCIVLLNPTESPVKHVQTIGRGGRIAYGKQDCLVLDFAGNTVRLGPINNVLVKSKYKTKQEAIGDPITKTCDKCQSIVAPAVRICPDCGFKFPISHRLNRTAYREDIIQDGKDHWIKVEGHRYEINKIPGRPRIFKAIYTSNGRDFIDWVCLEHKGAAGHKGKHWAKYRGVDNCNTVEELMSRSADLMLPSEMLIQKRGKYFLIKDYKFEN